MVQTVLSAQKETKTAASPACTKRLRRYCGEENFSKMINTKK